MPRDGLTDAQGWIDWYPGVAVADNRDGGCWYPGVVVTGTQGWRCLVPRDGHDWCPGMVMTGTQEWQWPIPGMEVAGIQGLRWLVTKGLFVTGTQGWLVPKYGGGSHQ